MITAIALLIIYKSTAQSNVIDTLVWDNGNYSLVSELDPVWIDQKKGPTIKYARIHTIDIAKGQIEYLLDGTYHDLLISNVEKILPGKYYDHVIVFKTEQTPTIIREEFYDFSYSVKGKFPSKGLLRQKPVIKEEAPKAAEVTEPIENEYAQANSAIIFENGKKMHIKLISINSQNISYKRLDLLNGPTYIMNLSIPGSMKQARVNVVNGYTIIDYRF